MMLNALALLSAVLSVATGSISQGILERDALGETLTVGTFYDARKSLVMNGASFWSQSDLESNVVNMNTFYSTVDVDMDSNSDDNKYKMDISAELHLSVMSGEIEVDGSARYLRDTKDNNDVSRAVLKYRATKRTDLLPQNTPKTYPELCGLIDDNTGPTHVISSIVYGLRANFVFDTAISKDDNKQSINGKLKIKLNNLPNFKLDAEADVTMNNTDTDDLKDTTITFYGDAIPTKMPGTYEQVKETFDEIHQQAIDGEKLTPIRYQLTPIGYYCSGIDAVLNEISHTLTSKATSVLSELSSLKTRVKTLLNTEPALRFPSIRKQLITFQDGLSKFTSDITESIATTIPEVKAGTKTLEDFATIISDYTSSVYNKDRADIFLDHRAREINTIQLVTDKAQAAPSVVLSDRGEASDNKCIFSSKYATVYQLYVLPSEDVAATYIAGDYDSSEEADKWFNDLESVGEAGSQLLAFLDHAAATANDRHCSLIRLDNIENKVDKETVIIIYQNGAEVESDFVFPGPPAAPECTRPRFSSFVISAVPNTLPASHVAGFQVTATWKKAMPPRDDQTERFAYFPTTFDVDNTDTFEISGLDPDKEYEIKVAYRIPFVDDIGPQSEPITCKTTATSPPLVPRVRQGDHLDEIIVEWEHPVEKVEGIDDADITYQVSLFSSEIDKSTCVDRTVDQYGLYYRGTVSTTYQGAECANWEFSESSEGYRSADYPGHGLGNHNYCRNPDGEEDPWCFLATPDPNGDTWDFCSVPDCTQSDLERVQVLQKRAETTPSRRKSVTFSELESGQLYEVIVRAVYDKVASEKAGLIFGTKPSPPSAPTLSAATENSIDIRVDISSMRMKYPFTMDTLKVLYTKVSVTADRTVYGTTLTRSVDIAGISDVKQVRVDGLSSGSWYDVQVLVQTRMPSGEILETDASQGILVLTVPSSTNEDGSALITSIDQFQTQLDTILASTETALSDAKPAVTQMKRIVASYNSLSTDLLNSKSSTERSIRALDPMMRALLKQSCIKRGIKYSDYTAGSTSSYSCMYSGLNHEYECMNNCVNRCNRVTEAIRFANPPSPEAGECVCLTQRSGGIVEKNGFYTSINKKCWDTFSATAETFSSCTIRERRYTGSDIYSTKVVGSIVDCVRLCTEEQGCDGIVFNESQGTCWLKRSIQRSSQADSAYTSIELSCLLPMDNNTEF